MQPRFIAIKKALLDQIENRVLQAGDRIPSENQLAEQFAVSRMTARRALSELEAEGVLMRTKGLGTFVSDVRPMGSVMTITPIDQEIEQRGHRHSSRIIQLESISANEQQSGWLGVPVGSTIFHSQIVHFEDALPIQFEDRLVNPKWAPEYLQQDFSKTTTSVYLNSVAPLTEADHIIEACFAESLIAEILQLPAQQPCLKISRRTFSSRGIVNFAQLYHPGNRYRLGGHLDF